ncbi:stereocilin [Mobula birostris]|uniref:stereocilin n=1 Tax=Mobula birostris TaxID=1983395 RepID=UPI003B286F17
MGWWFGYRSSGEKRVRVWGPQALQQIINNALRSTRGRLHNLTWHFEAVTLDHVETLRTRSPAESDLRGTASLLRLLSELPETPTACSRDLLLWANRTVCRDRSRRRRPLSAWLAVSCGLLRALTQSGSAPLMNQVCRGVALVSSHLTHGVDLLVRRCATTRPGAEGSAPANRSRLVEAPPCHYDSNLYNSTSLGYCSFVDEAGFREVICHNASLVAFLIVNPAHYWLGDFCATSPDPLFTATPPTETARVPSSPAAPHTDPPPYSVEVHCRYKEWAAGLPTQHLPQVAFCAGQDPERFAAALCLDGPTLQQLLQGSPWLLEFCDRHVSNAFCQYGRWAEVVPDPSIVALCWNSDPTNFTASVCFSGSLLRTLRQDASNGWLAAACRAENKCRYAEWLGGPGVAPALVTFCRDLDPAGFELLVCTSSALLAQLLRDPGNSWLRAECAVPTSSTAPDPTAVADLCRYETWTRPGAADTTLVALCFSKDGENFYLGVCLDPPVLQQLLEDHLNVWLLDFCNIPPTWEATGAELALACRYSRWSGGAVDPDLVDFCWTSDPANFTQFVCQDGALVSRLLRYPENEWLRSHCNVPVGAGADANASCRYEEWAAAASADPADVEFCSQYDPDNFVQSVCDNSTLLWELLGGADGTRLAALCSYAQEDGIDAGTLCRYGSWLGQRVEPTTVTQCFDHDQSNFNQFVCRDPGLLQSLSSDPLTAWVVEDCISIGTPSPGTGECPMHDLISRLQWTCSQGPPGPCPHPHPLFRLQDAPTLVLCGLEHIGLTLDSESAEELTAGLTEAINGAVLGLMALEDDRISFLRLRDNARNQVLRTVVDYLRGRGSYRDKKEALQCFGSVLWDFVQKEGGSSAVGLVEEYMKVSAADLQAVLHALDAQKTKQLLHVLNTNWSSLQIRDDLRTVLASVFFKRILLTDPNMFPEFVYLLPHLSASEIRALPVTLDTEEVLAVVDQVFGELSDDQRAAFVQWVLSSGRFNSVTTWPLTFLQHMSKLLVFLPFERFQRLSRSQILIVLDDLLASKLTTIQERFLIHTVLKGGKTIGKSDFERLGRLICSAASQDLEPYKQNLQTVAVIKEQLLDCIGDQIFVPNELLTDFLVRSTSIIDNGLLVTNELSSLVSLLPILGLSFLKQLHPAQIQAVLPELSTVNFTSVQARAIIERVLQNVSITEELLNSLGSTVIGLSPSILRVIPSALFMNLLPSMAAYERRLSPVQKLMAVNKFWESDNKNFLKNLGSLAKDIPLISLRSKVNVLMSNTSCLTQVKWSVQQAQMLFGKILQANDHNMTEDTFSALGFVAQGVDCATLQHLATSKTFLNLLQFFRDLPTEMPVSLRSCVLEALNSFVLTTGTVRSMKPQLLFDLQLLKIRRFSINMTQQLLQVIVKNPIPFLQLPSSKQGLMVDWIVQVLNLYGRKFSKAEFDLLEFAVAFITDEMFMEIPRAEMKANLFKLKDYCFDRQKKLLLGDILTKNTMFGDPTNWTSLILDKVDRLLFFLSVEDIQKLPKDVLVLERIEILFHSQKQWEGSVFGSTCQRAMEPSDHEDLFRKQRILLQTAVGLLNPRRRRQTTNGPVLTCNIIRTTLPSAWPVDSLTGMADDDFINCLEMIGQDPHFQPFELLWLLERVKQIYRPVSVMPPQVIEQLGRIATQFPEKDLMRLDLSDLGAVAALGKTAEWTNRKLSVLFTTFLHVNRLRVDELDSASLVALGHIICGIKPADMSAINPMQFSMAVLWIGSLSLPCDESQLRSLAGLVVHPETFGDVSLWGAEEFIEVGSIAAGLPDMVLSSLVKEQVEGLTPNAIAALPPKKLSVVFSPAQIRMFNYQQAVAVTPAQLKELGDVQKKALDMVLTSWHKTAVDIRGRSSGRNLSASLNGILLCLFCNLLHTREAYL